MQERLGSINRNKIPYFIYDQIPICGTHCVLKTRQPQETSSYTSEYMHLIAVESYLWLKHDTRAAGVNM